MNSGLEQYNSDLELLIALGSLVIYSNGPMSSRLHMNANYMKRRDQTMRAARRYTMYCDRLQSSNVSLS